MRGQLPSLNNSLSSLNRQISTDKTCDSDIDKEMEVFLYVWEYGSDVYHVRYASGNILSPIHQKRTSTLFQTGVGKFAHPPKYFQKTRK